MDTRMMKLGLVLLAAVGSGGCASGARMVRADARGGELETWGPVVPATVHMREMLVEYCRGRFTLVEQDGLRGDTAAEGHERVAFTCNEPRPLHPGLTAPKSEYPIASAAKRSESVAAVTPELRSEP